MKLIEKIKSKFKRKDEEKSSNIIMLPVVSHEQRYRSPDSFTDPHIRRLQIIEKNKRKLVQCICVFVMIYLLFIVAFGQSIYFMNCWKKAEEKVSELNTHISQLTNENEELIEMVAELEAILNDKSENTKRTN
ncbi:MAG: hypothetical protein E7544_01890 [Ruminococcaceae bacterium]|nr:hypothetical protein [Oscillospiraceae bacterium]